MATFQESDLAQKLLLVAQFKNRAKEFAELADNCAADLSLITTRAWGVMTDAELADLGLTPARLTAYVAFITQFNKLMTLTSQNLALTATSGRAAVDGIRNL